MTLPEQPQPEGEGPAQERLGPFSKGDIDLEEGIVVIPGVGVGKILRTGVPIHEHLSKVSGRPCHNASAVEVLFAKGVRRLVCDTKECLNTGVMEAPE